MTVKNNFMEGCVCTYAAPSVTVLDIQSEGLLCTSGEFNLGGGGVYGDDDINDNGSY